MDNSGIPELDRQHRELFSILLKLKSKIGTDDEQYAVRTFLLDLKHYAIFHFTCEEDLMKKYGYYDFKNHKDTHEDFLEMINETIIDYTLTEIFPAKIITFTEAWLMQHIEVEEELFKMYIVPKMSLFSSSGKTPVS